ncbi:MAG: putative MPP superfamily phosphohydrolase, partial [Myxococcota bacterium]
TVGFDLAGIPDPSGSRFRSDHAPNLTRTLAGRDPDNELILLAHRPNPIDIAAKAGVGLQLSGHTHGGQFFPITLGAELVHPYNAGLHRHGPSTQIYVSRGTGFWGPPIRILAPAEITSLVLTA